MASEEALQVKIDMMQGDMADIKAVLNRMSEALTKLALVEQQQGQTADGLARAFKALAKHEARLNALEKVSQKTRETSVWVDRFILAVVVAAGNYVAIQMGILH